MKFSPTAYWIALTIATSTLADARTLKPVSQRVSLSNSHRTLHNKQQDVDLVALIDEQLAIRGGAGPSALVQRLKVGFYFSLWYALNVIYNGTCLVSFADPLSLPNYYEKLSSHSRCFF